ncbi:GrpB family protein [Paenibacillaceae bacterium WGS1546]|uniref:GrpB family protein n=1 Tax=Cohnella sp. WGS1546 TaxID=3366810 RepID=UPI00372D42F2
MTSMQNGSHSTPISDEELQKITVGERKPHNATISLAEYDPRWPELFEQQAHRIRAALGDKALRVEHVGSTSVPGLCAKPIIDLLLSVADSADESAYVPFLEAAGYTLRVREPEWFEHRLFKGPDIDINLHVFSEGASEIKRMLRFRDWLRANDADRDYYANAKRSLAQRVWRHVQHYADAKTSVVQEIMDRANATK